MENHLNMAIILPLSFAGQLRNVFAVENNFAMSINELLLLPYNAVDIFGKKDLEAFEKINTADDFSKFILNPTTQNIGVKALLNACLDSKNISFDKNLLRVCQKSHIKIIFDNLFDFGEDSLIQLSI